MSALSEDRRARHEGVRSRPPCRFDGLRRDPAVHFERGPRTVAVEQGSGPFHLVGGGRDIRLTTESGIDAHQEQQIEVGHYLLDQRQRARWIERKTSHHPPFPNRRQVPLHMDRRLRMEGEHAHAEVGVLGDVPLRLHHHEVHIEGRVGELPERLDERGPKREVGDEAPIHHIDVQPLRATGQGRFDLFTELSEIGREETGRDSDSHQLFPATMRSTRVPLPLRTPPAGF